MMQRYGDPATTAAIELLFTRVSALEAAHHASGLHHVPASFSKVQDSLSEIEERVAKLGADCTAKTFNLHMDGGLGDESSAAQYDNDPFARQLPVVLGVLESMGLSQEVIARLPKYMESVSVLEEHMARLEQISNQQSPSSQEWTVMCEVNDLRDRLSRLEDAGTRDNNPPKPSEAIALVHDAVAGCQSQQRTMCHSLGEHNTALEQLKLAIAEQSIEFKNLYSIFKDKGPNTDSQGDHADAQRSTCVVPTNIASGVDSHAMVWVPLATNGLTIIFLSLCT
jgi:hypothetical protein